ncbi:MAG: hypothetical protein NTU95_05550 [Methanothrix sp.]|nr:hypothetical protein [Methanothrix sp.]
MKNIRPIILLCITAVLLASCASAFPLSGQSGQAGVTVYGIITQDLNDQTMRIFVDIGKAPNHSIGTVSLVDSEDKFYSPSMEGTEHLDSGWHKDRFFLSYDVPKGTVIKRLKIEPMLPGHKPGEPFSINWDSIPEASNGDLEMKMYGVKSYETEAENEMSWMFDIKLSSNYSENIPISAKDFSMVDQYGWEYDGTDYVDSYQDLGQLTPGESMRFGVTFTRISKLSRPVMLKYKGINLDISAWTG